jgi:hypothetical protein
MDHKTLEKLFSLYVVEIFGADWGPYLTECFPLRSPVLPNDSTAIYVCALCG